MSDMNRVILIGRLTRDPEVRFTQNGSAVADFSIANGRNYTANGEKKEYTSFFNCIAWAKLGEAMAQYCKKGQLIGIEGRLQQRPWEDKDGKKRESVEVVVDNFQFLTPKSSAPGTQTHEEPALQAELVNGSQGDNPFSDSDIPF